MIIKLIAVFLFVASNILAQTNHAAFSSFEYRGKDACFERKMNVGNQFQNPILPGFYPDPSICRRGEDYFLINSTFSYFPGIPIFHSRDLVHWKQIGNVLNRPSQLKLDGLGVSSGVYAPAIEYNERNQTFYIINTVVGGIGNFIVKTKDPFKEWSVPIPLPDVKGIDPSLFFDDDGKSYIVCSQASPKPQWSGHTVLWLHEFDASKDEASADRLLIVDGGPDTIQHPRWLEGPHLYKERGYYYLMAAEGGTQSGHKEVIFRSKQVKGPYVPAPNNPILTQVGLPADRPEKVTNVGHADLIKTPKGDWYAVFLGCRPYADEQFNTGRETFLLPVTWVDEFPVILEKGKSVPLVVGMQGLAPTGQTQSGNGVWRDSFNKPKLDLKWMMLRTPREQWWRLSKGKLVLEVLPRSLSQQVNAAYLGRRQQHLCFDAATTMDFTPKDEKELAGMAYFQNEKNYLVLGKTLKDCKQVMALYQVANGKQFLLAYKELTKKQQGCTTHIRMTVNDGEASFHYSFQQGTDQLLAEKIQISHMSTKKAGGFVGSTVGVYATANGL